MNWKNKQEVVKYCETLFVRHQKPLLVIQYQGRIEYNIIPRDRYSVWQRPDVNVIHEANS